MIGRVNNELRRRHKARKRAARQQSRKHSPLLPRLQRTRGTPSASAAPVGQPVDFSLRDYNRTRGEQLTNGQAAAGGASPFTGATSLTPGPSRNPPVSTPAAAASQEPDPVSSGQQSPPGNPSEPFSGFLSSVLKFFDRPKNRGTSLRGPDESESTEFEDTLPTYNSFTRGR
jgi:hypothetical protein